MKKLTRTLICALCLITLLMSMSAVSFAAEKQGWHTDGDGKERYYENGSYVTGIYDISGIPFEFASDGASLGVYDGYKAPGTAGKSDTSEYEAEIAKKTVLYSCDYNKGTSFNGSVASDGFISTSSLNHPKKSRPYQHVVLKQSQAVFSAKGDGAASENLVMRVINSTKTDATSAIDSYIDVNFDPTKKDIVFEAEYKLGADINLSNTITFLSAIDRSTSSSSLFISLLRLNQEGYVISATADELLCKLSKDEFTRISVAIHRDKNTYSVYVNGVLVKADLPFYTANAVDHKTIAIEQFRTFQFNGSKPNQGSFYIDNLYVYEGNVPVCTEKDPSPKNGICVDGGYLRYYQNNIIITGKRTVSGTYLGITLDNEYLTFNSLTGRASVGAKVEVKVDGKVTSSFLASNNAFTAPAAVDIVGKHFVGWKVTDVSGNSNFVRAGETVKVTSNVTCEAVGVRFDLLDGASVKITDGSAALRYIAKIYKEDLEELKAMGLTVEPHMVIVPTAYLDKTFGYTTVDALKKSGFTDISDTAASGWFDETEKYYYYSGTVENIDAAKYLEEYSAVAYLKVSYADGTSEEIYADHDAENNSRCVYEVAEKAYNDRITVKGYEGYANKVKVSGGETYSPYNKAQLGVIKNYVDKVISLKSIENGVTSAGSFYEAPYKISNAANDTGFDVTVNYSALSEALGVMLDGKLLASSDYEISGNQCKLSVEGGKVALGVTSDEEEAEEWMMLDAGSSKTVFGKSVILPEEAPNGAEKGFYWSFSKMKSPELNLGELGEYYKDRGIYDMSDWRSISFYIYVEEEYKGATFYFNFYSENPDTEGTDYYAYAVKASEAGWNKITVNKSSFNANRSPIGWDQITSISWPTTGWSMANDPNTEMYLTSIVASDKELASGALDMSKVEDAAVFSVGGFASIINGVKLSANPNDPTAVAFEDENGVYFLPVSCLAASVDNDAVYYPATNKVVFDAFGSNYVFGEGKYYEKDGVKTELNYPARLNGEAVFISIDDAMIIFEYNQKYIDRMGLIALWYSDSSDPILDSTSDHEAIFALMQECIYERPTGEKIVEDLNAYSGGQHPYLMLNAQDFEKLSYYKDMDETLQSYIKKLDSSYGIKSSKFKSAVQYFRRTDGRRLLSVSRDVMGKVISWSLLYKLGGYDEAGKAAIANRIWAELDAVSKFYDKENKKYSWNPDHFLDTAEMAYGVAIAYDWMYDVWTPAQRAQIEKALYELALKQTSALGGSYNLAGATNNWNGVCNGGIMAAALAIANVEAYQKDVITVLGTSIKAVEKGMWVYAPDGGYEEGPGYWSYGTTYLQVFMSCLDKACGTNYGLYNSPGFAYSAYFTTYLGNANTTWGFHDGGSGDTNPEIAAWFALKSGDGNLNAIRRNGINNGWTSVSMYDIMYFSPHIINNSINLALDSYYSLDSIMTFRSSWDTSNNMFVGLHGGDNAASHGDLDIGNFVINVNGTFMIGELGSEAYNVNGYFGSYRWSYYRKRAEGQNTLVMLPSGQSWDGKTGVPQILQGTQVLSGATPKPDQVATAISETLRFECGNGSAIGVVDTKSAYNGDGNVTALQRGLWMKDNRSTVVIQDEGSFKRGMDIWWFAHTQGKITVSEDGKSAYIYRNGIYLYAEIVTDISDAKFTVMNAVSLDKEYVGDSVESGQYSSEVETSRASFTKLCITAKNVKDYKLAVVFTVIPDADSVPEFATTYQWTDMKEWKVD